MHRRYFADCCLLDLATLITHPTIAVFSARHKSPHQVEDCVNRTRSSKINAPLSNVNQAHVKTGKMKLISVLSAPLFNKYVNNLDLPHVQTIIVPKHSMRSRPIAAGPFVRRNTGQLIGSAHPSCS